MLCNFRKKTEEAAAEEAKKRQENERNQRYQALKVRSSPIIRNFQNSRDTMPATSLSIFHRFSFILST